MDKYSELYAFLYRSAKELISEFENMLLIVRDEKFPAEMEEFVGKLQRLADHATHEIQDLTPIQEETEEFQITDADTRGNGRVSDYGRIVRRCVSGGTCGKGFFRWFFTKTV